MSEPKIQYGMLPTPALKGGLLARFKGADGSIYIALCLHVNERWSAFPSLDTIAGLTGLNRTTVTRCLRHLEQVGAIERERSKGGTRKSTRYRVVSVNRCTDAPVEGGGTGAGLHSEQVHGCTPTGAPVHLNRCTHAPLTTHEQPINSSSNSTPAAAGDSINAEQTQTTQQASSPDDLRSQSIVMLTAATINGKKRASITDRIVKLGSNALDSVRRVIANAKTTGITSNLTITKIEAELDRLELPPVAPKASPVTTPPARLQRDESEAARLESEKQAALDRLSSATDDEVTQAKRRVMENNPGMADKRAWANLDPRDEQTDGVFRRLVGSELLRAASVPR